MTPYNSDTSVLRALRFEFEILTRTALNLERTVAGLVRRLELDDDIVELLQCVDLMRQESRELTLFIGNYMRCRSSDGELALRQAIASIALTGLAHRLSGCEATMSDQNGDQVRPDVIRSGAAA